jgi:hypothetical protein
MWKRYHRLMNAIIGEGSGLSYEEFSRLSRGEQMRRSVKLNVINISSGMQGLEYST